MRLLNFTKFPTKTMAKMSFQSISVLNHILNPNNHLSSSFLSNSPFLSVPNPKSATHLNSISGYYRVAKTVTNCRIQRSIHATYTSISVSVSGFSNAARGDPQVLINSVNCSRGVKAWCGASGTGIEPDDRYYMRMAVELARTAIGCTSPNPMVGCVIVKDGKVVGQGFHPKAGQFHAEVFALKDAGELAENATAYVSLEPCNHHGRTPPCTEAFIKAKVKKVVVGMVDPNPIVASKGVDRLRDAGIEVIVGVEEELCKKLLEAYTHKMLTGKPFVTLRYSMSANGSLLDQLGEEAADPGGYYSLLLQEYDAVIKSLRNSAKDFTLSLSAEPKTSQPLQVLVAKNSDSPISMPNLALEETVKTVIFSKKELSMEPGAASKNIETVVVGQLGLDTILEYCSKQGSCSVLIDFRGDFHGLKEILKKCYEKKLVQKVMVEVLPLWAGDETNIQLDLTRQMHRLGLNGLSARTLRRSVLLEGYF